MIDYKAIPYRLDDEDIAWVEETLASMTEDEKLGQIFIQLGKPDDEAYLESKLLQKHVGGVLFRAGESGKIRDAVEFLQARSPVPLLVCGNLEEGGIGLLTDGTYFSKQMGVAATGDASFAKQCGEVAAKEVSAVGCQVNFGPVVDMCLDWHSAITNTNSFGADAGKVYAFASANMKAFQEAGMATAVKHFPGEGHDDRDQHYQTEVNGMTCEEWDETFGMIFGRLIEEGTLAVMPGHIALPSYQKKFNASFGDEILPATFSKELLTDLLRTQMGFNGLVISDTTTISGFTCYLPRAQALPQMVAAGVDLILYSYDMEEDLIYLKEGLKNGVLSKERLEEALRRVLATKAALRLPRKQKEGRLLPDQSAMSVIGCDAHREQAAACADRAVTLVKDTQKLLPIRADERKRVLVTIIADAWEREQMTKYLRRGLETRGFKVTVTDPDEPLAEGVEAYKKRFDWILYAGRVESAHKDKTVLRIQWQGNGTPPRFVCDIPTVYISFGNPFDLYDVPMMKTYVNAYTGNEVTVEAALDKLTGQSPFYGQSVADPFCGMPAARL